MDTTEEKKSVNILKRFIEFVVATAAAAAVVVASAVVVNILL